MKLARMFSLLGPGIVWASTSIGVSHIVQSTRAGADYGLALVAFILLAFIVKYPFFRIGPQYAATTGRSLLDGYKGLGNWAFYLYLLCTFAIMFFVQAGVTIVTSALAVNLFGDFLNVSQWSALILSIVVILLIVGRYQLLSLSLKGMMLVLVVSSVVACVAATLQFGVPEQATKIEVDFSAPMTIAFIVALMGWMPTSIDVSVWHSLWTLSRLKKPGDEAVRNALFDFKVGYMVTAILALVFVWLGTILMFDSGESFSPGAAAFARELVGIYSSALGEWSWLLMAIVTFVALFSTTFAVSDGAPQVWKRAFIVIKGGDVDEKQSRKIYVFSLILLAIGGWWIIAQFASNIKGLLDFVTTVSFITAPFYAWLNYKVIMGSDVPEHQQPRGIFKYYTLSALVAMTLFSVFFVVWRFS